MVASEVESSMGGSSNEDRSEAGGVRVGVGESRRDLLSLATISEIYASKTESVESCEGSRGQRESSLWWEKEMDRSKDERSRVPLGDVGEKIRGSMAAGAEAYRRERGESVEQSVGWRKSRRWLLCAK